MARADELDPLGSLTDWVAYDLRRYRTDQGLSQAAVGRRLDLNRQAVHNYESGIRMLDIEHARKLDRLWRTAGHFERLVTHAGRRHDSDWFRQFARHEQRARAIRTYEALVVPGLLQTEHYARALLTAGGGTDVEALVTTRMGRKAVFDRDPPPYLWVLLDETLLSRPVGGPAVMRAQLAYLLEMSALPNVSLRVVPVDVGWHVGLDGPFEIIETASDTIAYLEAQGGGRLVRGDKEVTRMALNYESLGAQALPETLSRRLVGSAMEGFQ